MVHLLAPNGRRLLLLALDGEHSHTHPVHTRRLLTLMLLASQEYSISASIMAMGIALSLGLREQNILACIFMLHWTTMWLGFLTEYVSVPKYHQDTTKYLTPIGRLQFEEFANYQGNKNEWTTQTNYRDYDKGANALKIINQVEWEVRTTAHATPCPPALSRRPCVRRATAPQRTSVWRISAPTIPTRPIRSFHRGKWPSQSRSRCTAASSTRKRRGTTFGA